MLAIHLFHDGLMKLGTSRLAALCGRIAAGIVGVLILAGFLALLLTPTAVTPLLPVIVGFNTALTGYGLIAKSRHAFTHKRLAAIGAGVAVVLLAAVGTNLLFWQLFGVTPVELQQLWVLVPVGSVTSWLGGALAVRYFQLH
ncbi:MAG: hypothetical protein QNJ22_10150 [Desulfosarcinaceae bacterium]|nr:hypothetical protein [Desulfosarcinaceae bacterium]